LLVIWHAFWGMNVRPTYAEISKKFGAERVDAMREICAAPARVSSGGRSRGDDLGTGIDVFNRMALVAIYLSTEAMDTSEALWITAQFLLQF
jgi:hypothetical protein